MKKLLALLLSAALVGLAANVAQAAEAQATEAKVLKVTGSASVQLPGQSGSVAVTEGMNLPVGSAITTGSDGDVEIQPMAGTITSVKKNSTVTLDELSVNKNSSGVVTKQTAQVTLKSGNVVSSLDPARKSINNYGVRTPKGVAAARGTVYGVGVNVTAGTSSVATLAGTVTFTTATGVAITVDIASGMVVGSDGAPTSVSLASLVAAETAAGGESPITAAIAAAVETVSNSVASGATSGDSAVSILAAVVNVASQANPAAASTFTAAAVTAVTSPTASLGTSGATNAAAAVTEAAVQGAVQGTIASGGSAEAAQAVTNAVTTSATTAATTSAASGGTAVSASAITSAAAAGAATGTTNGNAQSTGPDVAAPTVTTTTTTTTSAGTTTTTTPVVTPPTSTPITPVDPTVVSP